MRSTLLAGAAVFALFVALPSGFPDEVRPPGVDDAAAFDPLDYLASICQPRASGQPALLARFLSAANAYAATPEGAAAAAPPLILGAASGMMEATVNEAASPSFQQGMGLVDGFNHMEGVRAFRAAQAPDPDCAMCFWGEAYALGPNINKVMDPADNLRAIDAAKLALEKATGASEVEQALIEAPQVRYSDLPDADRATLDAAPLGGDAGGGGPLFGARPGSGAGRRGDHGHPALGLLGAGRPGGEGERGAGALAHRGVLARNPDHVLAIHLHIHSTEASNDPWRSLP